SWDLPHIGDLSATEGAPPVPPPSATHPSWAFRRRPQPARAASETPRTQRPQSVRPRSTPRTPAPPPSPASPNRTPEPLRCIEQRRVEAGDRAAVLLGCEEHAAVGQSAAGGGAEAGQAHRGLFAQRQFVDREAAEGGTHIGETAGSGGGHEDFGQGDG